MIGDESGPGRRQNGTARQQNGSIQKTVGARNATPPPEPLQSPSGEALKLSAQAFLEARRELIILRGRRALLTVLLRTGRATADDVRDTVELPEGIDPVCLGAVPGALARTGIIERIGFGPSSRADAHARPVSVWRLADRDAALAWLAVHPDRPDPVPDKKDAEPTLFDLAPTATPGAAR